MNTSHLLSIAATLLAGSAAQAQPARDTAQPRAAQTSEQVLAMADKLFARMDANGDSRIDAADRDTRQRARLDRLDADSDGAVSFAEMQQARERGRERMSSARDERTQARVPGERRRVLAGMGGMRHVARAADTDQDGAISHAEFRTAALARFERADADGNGTVTAEERRALREQRMRGERRGTVG